MVRSDGTPMSQHSFAVEVVNTFLEYRHSRSDRRSQSTPARMSLDEADGEADQESERSISSLPQLQHANAGFLPTSTPSPWAMIASPKAGLGPVSSTSWQQALLPPTSIPSTPDAGYRFSELLGRAQPELALEVLPKLARAPHAQNTETALQPPPLPRQLNSPVRAGPKHHARLAPYPVGPVPVGQVRTEPQAGRAQPASELATAFDDLADWSASASADQGTLDASEETSDEAHSRSDAGEGDVEPREPQFSIGSRMHGSGKCKPCAFFHKKGCEANENCPFCHICDRDEKKRRRQQQRASIRQRRALREERKAAAASRVQPATSGTNGVTLSSSPTGLLNVGGTVNAR